MRPWRILAAVLLMLFGAAMAGLTAYIVYAQWRILTDPFGATPSLGYSPWVRIETVVLGIVLFAVGAVWLLVEVFVVPAREAARAAEAERGRGGSE